MHQPNSPSLIFINVGMSSRCFFCGGRWEQKWWTNANGALLSAYRNSIARYQKLLKTHLTDLERNYIKKRLSTCQAAVKALIGQERISIWDSRAENSPCTAELHYALDPPRRSSDKRFMEWSPLPDS